MNMKTFYKLLVALFFAILPISAFADHPEAHYGKYGLQKFDNESDYQQYVGKTVVYFRAFCTKGDTVDDEEFTKKGGVFGKEYVISNITNKDTQMTFTLVEKGGKKKIKMIINNKDEYYSYGKYNYCITSSYTVPLFFIDDFNKDKSQYIGKIYPSNPSAPAHVEVVDCVVVDGTKYGEYPHIEYVLKNQETGEQFSYDPEFIEDMNYIGKVYSNPKYKSTYTVIKAEREKESYGEKYYTNLSAINSITGKVRKTRIGDNINFFSAEDDGKFFATLSKVEKPSNPEFRYGTTTTISDDKDITKFSYVDNFIDIILFAGSDQINFQIKNVSDNTIKIVWNEAVFVDVDGSTSKIMHAGTKYSEREGDQPASTIIKGAKLDDLAAPTNKVFYSDFLKKWCNGSLYSKADKRLDGQILRLMLPIQVKDVINEYIFEFELKYIFDHPECIAEEYYKL